MPFRKAVDHKNRTYYYDDETGETTWERPEFVASDDDAEEEGGAVEEGVDAVEAAAYTPVWRSAWDERKQKTYYYNEETGETTWDRPSAGVVEEEGGEGEPEPEEEPQPSPSPSPKPSTLPAPTPSETPTSPLSAAQSQVTNAALS